MFLRVNVILDEHASGHPVDHLRPSIRRVRGTSDHHTHLKNMAEYASTRFMSLPDELLLHVVSSLGYIQSAKPQAQAFRNREKESTRQRENHDRRIALHALCGTSQRLKRVSQSVLYSAFMGSATWSGFIPLCRFLRTLREEPGLARHVQYFENRLSDYKGNSLYDSLEVLGAVEMVKDYFDTLVATICLTPNLTHLSVVSLETSEVSLWRHIVKDKDKDALPHMAAHGFPKLESLCLQIHTEDYGIGEESAWFRRITNALMTVPTLKTLNVSGATSGSVVPIYNGKHKCLQDIQITESILDFDELVQLVSSCTDLKRLSCDWAYLTTQLFHLPDLHNALTAHADSLRTLRLDAREVRLQEVDSSFQPLPSLRDFTALQTVELCEASLFANNSSILDVPNQILPTRIAHLMPPSLRSLTILIKANTGYNNDRRLDEAQGLCDLADDCPTMLPNLHQVWIKWKYSLRAASLTARFRDVGVTLFLATDIWPRDVIDSSF